MSLSPRIRWGGGRLPREPRSCLASESKGPSGVTLDLGMMLALLGGAALGGGVALVMHRAGMRKEAHRRSRLAHDLRTPLSSILAYTELLEDGVAPEDGARFLSIIRQEAGRMAAMIDQRCDPAPANPQPPAAVVTTSGKERGAAVLVVDDDRFIVDATCRLLAGAGFRATGATDGASAMERAREQRPALILLDRAMPVMDGDETLRRLRAEPATRDIPVIITTGDAADDLPAGAFAVLTKPVSRESLLEAIAGALGAMSGGAAR